MTASAFDIPKHFKAGRPAWVIGLGRWLAKRAGWSLTGAFPDKPGKYVVPVAPHTSNWDFVIGLYLVLALDLKVNWLGKHTIFVPGVAKLWRALGGIPVDRAHPSGVLTSLEQLMSTQAATLIAIAPEGTRKKTTRWKTGFLRLACNANATVIPIGIDSKSKQFKVLTAYSPTGEVEDDLKAIQAQMSHCQGINPDNM
ncbi:acyltransferase [Alteromonas sediminis]|uniref:Acyltransferase n=1 Tax=Alteromonas sediminis TaxID=2259342 RepID=A0A3N5YQB2_9ALTE|nr:1-acyl-sn-glycerol-3-phosphate acyltransferase [Alteromonas sediminis]RPJ68261.1 acyltransferase [Alteromonas sediminis]